MPKRTCPVRTSPSRWASVALTLLSACAARDPLDVHIVSEKSIEEADDLSLGVDRPTSGLRYRWTQISPSDPKGVFSDPTGASTTWTAPIVCDDTVVTLALRVSSGGSEERSETIDVAVSDAVEAQPPAIALSATDVIAGDDVTARITVVGPGCGGEAIQWTEMPTAGTFSDSKRGVTKWRSGVIGADTDATLVVDVGGVSHSAVVHVRAPSHADADATFTTATCYECHAPGGRNPGGFDMTKLTLTQRASRSDCGSGQLIVPGNPGASILVKRLRRNGCTGSRMPWDDTAWFDEHPGAMVRIESWVQSGAPF